jgi:methyltransferase
MLVCGLMGVARLIELAISRRNIQRNAESAEGDWSRRTFPLIVALHTAVITGTLLRGGRVRLPWLFLLMAAQPLRAWVLLSLGRHWNARGAVATDMEVVTSGPYALVRHPNYAVVVAELAALPAAFSLSRLAAAATLANIALLKIRISDEEALLFQLPAYERHFRHRRRFLPFLF